MFQSESEELKELFENACLHVRAMAGSLGNEDLLYLYSRFKRAKDGCCETERPGFFNFQERKKWDAWKAMDSVNSETCMQEYIAKVTELDPTWIDDSTQCITKLKAGKRPKVGFGVGVSKMLVADGGGAGDACGIHDLCKEGLLDRLKDELEGGAVKDVNQLDDQGMAMLHWATDRGHAHVVVFLLSQGADVNIRDLEGQTPLHYAASCGYEEVTSLLLRKGADAGLRDKQQLLPADVASSQTLRSLLSLPGTPVEVVALAV